MITFKFMFPEQENDIFDCTHFKVTHATVKNISLEYLHLS